MVVETHPGYEIWDTGDFVSTALLYPFLTISEGINVEIKTPFWYRINHVLDIYPFHNYFHNLKSTKRGSYTDLNKLIKEQIHGN